MAGRQLQRSRDAKIAGVCGGIAEYLDQDPTLIRLVAVVLAMTTSAPIFMAYVVMALVVPEAPPSDPAVLDDARARWERDALRVSWTGPIAGYSYTWLQWLGGVAALGGGLVALAILVGVLALFAGLEPGLALGAGGLVGPLCVTGALAGAVRRPYALSCTQTALWVERPLRPALRLDLAQVEGVHRGAEVVVALHSGERLSLPLPADPSVLDDLVREVARGRQRMLAHHEDLVAAEPARRELQRVLAQQEREG